MNIRIMIGACGLAVFLGGCATMGKDECLVSDWRSVGYEDGVQGRTADRIGAYRKDCAKHGIRPDLTAYQAGRTEGLTEFCRPDNGFHVGSRGQAYRGVCPNEMADEFVASYRKGRQLYDLERRVRTVNRQINNKRRRLEQIDEQLLSTGTRLIVSPTTTEERVEMLAKTKNLATERGRVETEIPELIARKTRLEKELENYRGELAANY